MSKTAEPRLEFFCDLNVQLGAPIEMGAGAAGRRRIIPIIGGTVSGPHFEGKILNLGADWQTQFIGGTAHLDTRYAMESLDGVPYYYEPRNVLSRVLERFTAMGLRPVVAFEL